MRKVGQKALSMVLSIVLVCNMAPFQTIVSASERETSVVQTSDVKEAARIQELMEAVDLGFGKDVTDTSSLTYGEYHDMLTTLVEKIYGKDSTQLAAWREQYAGNIGTDTIINRYNAMYMLYACTSDILGTDYLTIKDVQVRYDGFHQPPWQWKKDVLDANFADVADGIWSEAKLNHDYFPDGETEEPEAIWGYAAKRVAAAYFFSFAQTAQNGQSLFEYDAVSGSMRGNDNLTMQEAMLSVVRLYNVVDHYSQENKWISLNDETALAYDKTLITDNLLKIKIFFRNLQGVIFLIIPEVLLH